MGRIHGVYPGHRAVHAKGLCSRGTFTATREAASLCTAPHLQGDAIPVTVRLSNGSGKPLRADGARTERGMGVKFHLPGGGSTDIVSLTLPVFFVRNPDDFLDFLEAQVPDPETGRPDLARIEAFVQEHPETQTAFGFLMFSEAPASFANCTFFGIHAFKLTAPDGTERYVRYQWIPDAGPATLSDDETRALGRDYLGEEFERRVSEGPVGYELFFQVANEEDDPTDPTVQWPEERERVAAGRLEVTELFDPPDGCKGMVFDPGNVIDGIERSNDLILHARSPAYSVSYERRSSA